MAPSRRKFRHDALGLPGGDGIETVQRFVENQQGRSAEQGGGDADLRPCAERTGGNQPVEAVLDAKPLENGGEGPAVRRAIANRRDEFEILPAGQSTRQVRGFDGKAESGLGLFGATRKIDPRNLDAAVEQANLAGEGLDQRRLARAIRAEQAEDIALSQQEIDAFDDSVSAIAGADIMGLQHLIHVDISRVNGTIEKRSTRRKPAGSAGRIPSIHRRCRAARRDS